MSEVQETVVAEEEPTTATEQEVATEGQTTATEDKSSSKETVPLPRNVERDEDGQLVMKRGSSVYKGKDLDDLMDNVARGIDEKDNYVLKLKTEKAIQPGKAITEEAEEVVELPNPDKIRDGVFSEYNAKYGKTLAVELKSEMSDWDVQSWRAFASANEIPADELADLKQIVRSASSQASKNIEKVDTEYINGHTRRQAAINVRELLTEFKLNPDDYTKAYSEALRAVDTDPLQKEGGIYNSGRIELAVAKQVIKDLIDKAVKGREQEVLKKVVDGNAQKEKVRGGTVSGVKVQPTVKIPETKREILDQLRAEGRMD